MTEFVFKFAISNKKDIGLLGAIQLIGLSIRR